MLFNLLLVILSVITVLVADRNFAFINKDNGNLPYALLCGCVIAMAGIVTKLALKQLTGFVTSNDEFVILLVLAATLPMSIMYSVMKRK